MSDKAFNVWVAVIITILCLSLSGAVMIDICQTLGIIAPPPCQ